MSYVILKPRRGRSAEWITYNTILEKSEIAFEVPVSGIGSGSIKMKMGNGKSSWKDLPYAIDMDSYLKQSDIAALKSSVNQLITSGYTGDPNAELLDIRVGGDGNVYETAGDAVRSIYFALQDAYTQLKDYADSSTSVNGFVEEDGYLYLAYDGEPVGDGILYSGGGGGGGTSSNTIIRLTNMLESTSFSVSTSSNVTLMFNFISEEDGNPIGNGTLQVYVNSSLKITKSIPQGANSIDVTKYIGNGINSVKVKVTDPYANIRVINYSINMISLILTSTFDNTQIYDGEIQFKYTAIGNVTKYMYIYIDDTLFTTETIITSGRQLTTTLPKQTHGSHKIKAYLQAEVDSMSVESNVLIFDMICASDDGDSDPIIASNFEMESVIQGTTLQIPYMVYSPGLLKSSVTLKILNQDGSIYYTNMLDVDRTSHIWSIIDYPIGDISFVISCSNIEKLINIHVDPLSINVNPISNGLSLYLDSSGRSNNDKNRDRWTSKDSNKIECILTDMTYSSNGWIPDDNGNVALKLSGDARLTIPFKIFDNDFKMDGKTIELDFSTDDVNDTETTLIDITGENSYGIKITSNTATFSSEQSTLTTFFKEEERVRISFVVEARTDNRLIYIYINGIDSGVVQYPYDDNFQQLIPSDIKIGSSDCTVNLYKIRVYDNALNKYEMLDNYIGDCDNIDEKIDRHRRNDIYDSYGNIVYSLLNEKLPCMLLQLKNDGDTLPSYKGDKKTINVVYEDKINPDQNFEWTDVQIDVQGTSSQFYPRKNYKIKIKGNDPYTLNDKEVLPASIFTIKADFAESSGTHNTGLTKYIPKLYEEKTPPQKENDLIRTTVYGEPMGVFVQDPEGTITFLGKYNFNTDKGAENTFGFTDEYPNCQCWEVLNNTSDRTLFLSDDFEELDLNGELAVLGDFESRYPDDDVENWNWEYIHSLCKWIVSTNVHQATNNPLQNIVNLNGVDYNVDSPEYRLAKFKYEFKDHFNMDYSLVYYIVSEYVAAVDSRAKNMMLATWDGIEWYPIFYDIDTVLGINNQGKIAYNYDVEYGDVDGTQDVFNGTASTLWNNFKDCFGNEIKTKYQDLRAANLLSYSSIIKILNDEQSSKWCEAVYNEDGQYKYIDPLINGYFNGESGENEFTSTFLYALQGSRENHRRWWLYNRQFYLDGKYFTGSYASDMITMRLYTPSEYTVKPDASFDIVPYTDMYVGIRYKANASIIQKRSQHNTTVHFDAPNETFNNTEFSIYNGSKITSIGDLSPKYPGTVDISSATKLEELILGSDNKNYVNTNLTELSVGNNILLRKIDLRGCTNLTQPLDLSKCISLKEVQIYKTKVSAVSLSDGGYIEILNVPNTITNLTLKNQTKLKEFNIYNDSKNNNITNSLNTISLDNISNAIDIVKLINNNDGSLSRIRLNNININSNTSMNESSNYSYADNFFDKINSLMGIDENGNNTKYPVVSGEFHFFAASYDLLSSIDRLFPDVKIYVDAMSLIKDYKYTGENNNIEYNSSSDIIDVINKYNISKVIGAYDNSHQSPKKKIYSYIYDCNYSDITNIISKSYGISDSTNHAVAIPRKIDIFYHNSIKNISGTLNDIKSVISINDYNDLLYLEKYGFYYDENHNIVLSDLKYASGNITMNIISDSAYEESTEKYPDLVINYTTMTTSVKFVNYNGSILNTQACNIGDLPDDPISIGAISIPVKPNNPQYTYSYKGWDKPITYVKSSGEIYTATYNETPINFHVKCYTDKNMDTILYSTKVLYGDRFYYTLDTPIYSGEIEDDVDFYIHCGWCMIDDNNNEIYLEHSKTEGIVITKDINLCPKYFKIKTTYDESLISNTALFNGSIIDSSNIMDYINYFQNTNVEDSVQPIGKYFEMNLGENSVDTTDVGKYYYLGDINNENDIDIYGNKSCATFIKRHLFGNTTYIKSSSYVWYYDVYMKNSKIDNELIVNKCNSYSNISSFSLGNLTDDISTNIENNTSIYMTFLNNTYPKEQVLNILSRIVVSNLGIIYTNDLTGTETNKLVTYAQSVNNIDNFWGTNNNIEVVTRDKDMTISELLKISNAFELDGSTYPIEFLYDKQNKGHTVQFSENSRLIINLSYEGLLKDGVIKKQEGYTFKCFDFNENTNVMVKSTPNSVVNTNNNGLCGNNEFMSRPKDYNEYIKSNNAGIAEKEYYYADDFVKMFILDTVKYQQKLNTDNTSSFYRFNSHMFLPSLKELGESLDSDNTNLPYSLINYYTYEYNVPNTQNENTLIPTRDVSAEGKHLAVAYTRKSSSITYKGMDEHMYNACWYFNIGRTPESYLLYSLQDNTFNGVGNSPKYKTIDIGDICKKDYVMTFVYNFTSGDYVTNVTIPVLHAKTDTYSYINDNVNYDYSFNIDIDFDFFAFNNYANTPHVNINTSYDFVNNLTNTSGNSNKNTWYPCYYALYALRYNSNYTCITTLSTINDNDKSTLAIDFSLYNANRSIIAKYNGIINIEFDESKLESVSSETDVSSSLSYHKNNSYIKYISFGNCVDDMVFAKFDVNAFDIYFGKNITNKELNKLYGLKQIDDTYLKIGIKSDKNSSTYSADVTYIEDSLNFSVASNYYYNGAASYAYNVLTLYNINNSITDMYSMYNLYNNLWFLKNNYRCLLGYDGTELLKFRYDSLAYDENGKRIDTIIQSQDNGGNVMTYIPLIWTKRYDDGNYEYIIISDKKYDKDFHAYAFTKSDGTIMDGIYLGSLPVTVDTVGRARILPLSTLYTYYDGCIDDSTLLEYTGIQNANSNPLLTHEILAKNNGDNWNVVDREKYELILSLMTILQKSNKNTTITTQTSNYYINYTTQLVFSKCFSESYRFKNGGTSSPTSTFYLSGFIFSQPYIATPGLYIKTDDNNDIYIYTKNNPPFFEYDDENNISKVLYDNIYKVSNPIDSSNQFFYPKYLTSVDYGRITNDLSLGGASNKFLCTSVGISIDKNIDYIMTYSNGTTSNASISLAYALGINENESTQIINNDNILGTNVNLSRNGSYSFTSFWLECDGKDLKED